MRCQAVVDALLGELKAAGKAPTQADGVCGTPQGSRLGTRAGFAVGYNFVVKILFDTVPEQHWERAWHDVAAHEIGHTYARGLTADQRAKFAFVTGLANYDEERFADTYAAVIGGVGVGALTYIKTPPAPEVAAALCAERVLPC